MHRVGALSILSATLLQAALPQQAVGPFLSCSVHLAVEGQWRSVVLRPVGVDGVQELLSKAFIYKKTPKENELVSLWLSEGTCGVTWADVHVPALTGKGKWSEMR